MKKKLLPVVAITAILLLFTAYGFKAAFKKETTAVSANPGFVVVELFTSEGCSSCPPAEDAIAKLWAKKIDKVYLLCYHVDYWDRLGWKDSYSQPEFTARQQKYARALSLKSTYTPEAVVNGTTEFVGSDEAKLTTAIQRNLQGGKSSGVSIGAAKHGAMIDVVYTIDSEEPVLLNLALIQTEATSNIKRGENSGRTLHHVNIVRALKTITATGKGTISLTIPDEINKIPLQLIAYTQAMKNLQILGADQKLLD